MSMWKRIKNLAKLSELTPEVSDSLPDKGELVLKKDPSREGKPKGPATIIETEEPVNMFPENDETTQ